MLALVEAIPACITEDMAWFSIEVCCTQLAGSCADKHAKACSSYKVVMDGRACFCWLRLRLRLQQSQGTTAQELYYNCVLRLAAARSRRQHSRSC